MHMLARRDGAVGETDDLAVFDHGLAGGDGAHGGLVPGRDRPGGARRAARQRGGRRQRAQGHRHIVARTQPDGIVG